MAPALYRLAWTPAHLPEAHYNPTRLLAQGRKIWQRNQPDKLTQIVEPASTLGVTLCLIDSLSKLDVIGGNSRRRHGHLPGPARPVQPREQDTVQLVETAKKLPATVGVINNVDKAGGEARIGEATVVMEMFKVAVCATVIRHRPELLVAAEKGRGVIELGVKAKTAADEIRALWDFPDERTKTNDGWRGEAHGAGGQVMMIKKQPGNQDRDGILGTLTRFGHVSRRPQATVARPTCRPAQEPQVHMAGRSGA